MKTREDCSLLAEDYERFMLETGGNEKLGKHYFGQTNSFYYQAFYKDKWYIHRDIGREK